ncbi:MAG: hypothetical protein COB22_08770 [Cycloclasticus sp.]|nr:MAG: hypothetical protein COB22_08770 [Cycloclasticus sp.]
MTVNIKKPEGGGVQQAAKKTTAKTQTARAPKLVKPTNHVLDEAPRETKTQFNTMMEIKVKNDFQAYCASIGKGRKQGQVFADVWKFYKEQHNL